MLRKESGSPAQSAAGQRSSSRRPIGSDSRNVEVRPSSTAKPMPPVQAAESFQTTDTSPAATLRVVCPAADAKPTPTTSPAGLMKLSQAPAAGPAGAPQLHFDQAGFSVLNTQDLVQRRLRSDHELLDRGAREATPALPSEGRRHSRTGLEPVGSRRRRRQLEAPVLPDFGPGDRSAKIAGQ